MNTEILHLVWVLICVSLFPVVGIYYVTFKRIIRFINDIDHVKINHLKGLGFIYNNNISASSKFIGFLINKDYKDVGDVELSLASDKCRILLFLGTFLAALAFFMPILIGRYAA